MFLTNTSFSGRETMASKRYRFVDFVIGALVAGTALLVFPFSVDIYLLPKAVLSKILILAWFTIWLHGRSELHAKGRVRNIFRMPGTPIDMPLLAVLLTSALSALLSKYPLRNGLDGLRTLILFMIAFYLFVERGKRIRRWLFDIGLASAVLISVHVILQDRGIDFLDLSGGVPDWRGHLAGTLGNPNFVGNYLGLWLPYAVLSIYSGKGLRVPLYAIAAVFIVATLTVTFCMGVWMALGAVLIILALYYIVTIVSKKRVKLNWAKMLLIACCFAAASAYYLTPNPLSGHPEGLLNEAKSSPRWRTGMGARKFIWKTTALMIGDHPMTGVGIGNYGSAHPLYQGRLYEIRDTPHDRPTVGIVPQVHNEYYQWLAETGVLGSLALLWLLFAFFKSVLQIWRRLPEDENRILWLSSFAGIIVFLVHSMVSFPFQLPANRIVGVLFAAVLIGPSAKLREVQPPTRVRKNGIQRQLAIVILIAVFLLAIDICRPLVASHLRARATTVPTGEGVRFLENAVRYEPSDAENWRYYGILLIQENRYPQAADALEESAKLYRQLATHELLFDLYTRMGLGNDLVRQAEAIVEINPCYPPNQVKLGNAYSLMGMNKKALKAFDQAIYLEPDFKDSLQEKREEVISRLGQ